MIALTLQRIAQNDFATYGNLADAEHKQLCVTLERPWLDNQPDVSCIPAGTYHATRRKSHLNGGTGVHNYDVFELTDVPGRGAIELHVGNLPHDSEGCVLLGSNVGTVNGQHGITGSQAAFARFMTAMQGVDAFTLTVVDPVPTIAH